MWWSLLLMNLLFLCAALFLFPYVALLLCRFRDDDSELSRDVKSIDIIIPCHNEQGKLDQSLTSIDQALREAKNIFPSMSFGIRVGLDSCHDDTLGDAQTFSPHVFSFMHRSKWKVICALLQSSTADWVVFVDAGIIWDPRLLRNALPNLANPYCMCFAPSYRTRGGGIGSRIFWKIESRLKDLENRSGGPISVHGATVFYRRENLLSAMMLLQGRTWINDDVVIPLMLRIIFPKQRIIYSSNSKAGFSVFDLSPREASKEKNSRERIAAGNLQWMKYLIPLSIKMNPMVLIFSMRRIFRLSWAVMPMLFLTSTVAFAIEIIFQNKNILLAVAIISSALFLWIFLQQQPTYSSSIRAIKKIVTGNMRTEETIEWN